MALLDPKIDIVFKLLLTQNQTLLRSVIECVLSLGSPIESLIVQNPDVERDLASDKGVVLDIRVELHDGKQIDLEMGGADDAFVAKANPVLLGPELRR